MYFLLPAILIFLIFCSTAFFCRRKCIIKKINSMSFTDKVCRLNQLIHPFGFSYELSQDIFTSCLDAWQRDYGYCHLYDLSSVHFNMVFDCEPVYFDYDGCTWLLEFWKGQYGINIGAEIGIYKADRILSPHEYESAYFHTVSDCELPLFSITLQKGTQTLYCLSRKHWWLAGFSAAQYTEPEFLSLSVRIVFPSFSMCSAFADSMTALGYSEENLSLCGSFVSFSFHTPYSLQPRIFARCSSFLAQWKNRLLLRLFCYVTKPFDCTVDQLLYLYEYLPPVFRRVICIQKKKRKRR